MVYEDEYYDFDMIPYEMLITHHGVKGMKWGIRRSASRMQSSIDRRTKKNAKYIKKMNEGGGKKTANLKRKAAKANQKSKKYDYKSEKYSIKAARKNDHKAYDKSIDYKEKSSKYRKKASKYEARAAKYEARAAKYEAKIHKNNRKIKMYNDTLDYMNSNEYKQASDRVSRSPFMQYVIKYD